MHKPSVYYHQGGAVRQQRLCMSLKYIKTQIQTQIQLTNRNAPQPYEATKTGGGGASLTRPPPKSSSAHLLLRSTCPQSKHPAIKNTNTNANTNTKSSSAHLLIRSTWPQSLIQTPCNQKYKYKYKILLRALAPQIYLPIITDTNTMQSKTQIQI